MFLLVGLGNPGARHAGNRHNIGFMVVDAIAKRHGFPPWRRRFQGVAAEGTLGGKKVQLLLPGTYMNESGLTVREAMQYLKTPLSNVIVFHDELQLPRGKVRVRTGGGNAGHNGLRSITAHIGNDYKRVRIGIGRPESKDQVHQYVLTDFPLVERAWVEWLESTIAEYVELLIVGEDIAFEGQVEHAMESEL